MAELNIESEPGPDSLPPRWQTAWRWGAPAATLAAVVFLAWTCLFDPAIHFLTPGPGRWILFPLPPQVGVYTGMELVGTFRREFILDQKPSTASLSWRCLDRGGLFVNGMAVPCSDSNPHNWKSSSQSDVAAALRPGTNVLEVLVTNAAGPPALSLKLTTDGISLISDESWRVSVSGSDWRSAQEASAVPRPGKGNELYPLESTRAVLSRSWPGLCVLAAISICVVALWRLGARCLAAFPKIVLAALAVVWLLLFLHNYPHIPFATGFDAPDHLLYVKYIQEHHRLPDVREGWEMFHPPLYYILAAAVLGAGHCQAFGPSGMALLRYLSLAIGAVHLALIFIGLRLIFPGDWKKPLAGVVLAAFLPAQVLLLHFATNETLSAMLVTGALCVTLRILRVPKAGWLWPGLLGIVLGLAIASKASALLAVPVCLAALALKLALRRERSIGIWLGALTVPLLLCLLVGGWHYYKLCRAFGSPFIGNWDPRVAAPWWQYKGVDTPHYFLSFGRALTRPYYSGLYTFWDGFYSTLWGDGLLGGKINLWSRPPWNYDFMTAGFLLALIPTAVVLTGLARALAVCFRAANVVWLLLLVFAWLFAFAILDMSLKVPSYAQAKAFYALPVMLPFCALGALGFEYWAARGKMARNVLGVAVALWLINLYASFWIRPETAQSELSVAIARLTYLKEDPTEGFANVLKQYPGNTQASIWLASIEARNHPDEAAKRLEEALKNDPANGLAESFLAWDLATTGKMEEALAHARHAVELAPEDISVAQTWSALAVRHPGSEEEAVRASRFALGLNPSERGTHLNLGLALANLGRIPEAIDQISPLVAVNPKWPEAQFYLGLCLLRQPGKRDQALAHMEQAVLLSPSNTNWRATLENARQGK